MAKIKDLPKNERPREKLEKYGPERLSNSELLAILLRTGYQGKSAIEVAKKILKTYKLKNLVKMHPLELSKIKGVGKSRAATLSAAHSLMYRVFKVDKIPTITTPEDVLKLTNYLFEKKKEYLVGIYLNARDQLLHTEVISVGTLTDSLVHPREFFEPAIRYTAASVFGVHNHPSNDSQPSEDDLVVTIRLAEAGKILGVELKDHIIVTKDGYFSFKERGLL